MIKATVPTTFGSTASNTSLMTSRMELVSMMEPRLSSASWGKKNITDKTALYGPVPKTHVMGHTYQSIILLHQNCRVGAILSLFDGRSLTRQLYYL